MYIISLKYWQSYVAVFVVVVSEVLGKVFKVRGFEPYILSSLLVDVLNSRGCLDLSKVSHFGMILGV